MLQNHRWNKLKRKTSLCLGRENRSVEDVILPKIRVLEKRTIKSDQERPEITGDQRPRQRTNLIIGLVIHRLPCRRKKRGLSWIPAIGVISFLSVASGFCSTINMSRTRTRRDVARKVDQSWNLVDVKSKRIVIRIDNRLVIHVLGTSGLCILAKFDSPRYYDTLNLRKIFKPLEFFLSFLPDNRLETLRCRERVQFDEDLIFRAIIKFNFHFSKKRLRTKPMEFFG